MHREGHVGTNLLVYAPFAFGLAWVGLVTPLAWGVLGVVLLSTLPDVDVYTSLISHRGPTHTVFFALLVGGLLGGAGVLLELTGFGTSVEQVLFGPTDGRVLASVGPADLDAAAVAGGAFGFFVGFLAVVGHLLGDVFTPMGVAPWKPISDRRHSLGWFNADSDLANTLWLVVGVVMLGLAVTLGTLLRTGVLVVRPPEF